MSTAIAQPTLLQEFLNRSTSEETDKAHLFSKDGVKGLYSPNISYDETSSMLISELSNWSCEQKPTNFPSEATGSFFFLIDKSAFKGRMDRNSFTKDWLAPWDKSRKAVTKWTKTSENGVCLYIGKSRHHLHSNYVRYISYLSSKNGRLASNILYQYIVEPEGSNETASPVASSDQKRKRSPINDSDAPNPKKKYTRKNTELPLSTFEFPLFKEVKPEPVDHTDSQYNSQQEHSSNASPLMEVKPETLDPTCSEWNSQQISSVQMPSSPSEQNKTQLSSQPQLFADPSTIMNVENAFNMIQKAMSDLNAQFVSATSVEEKTKIYEKTVQMFNIECYLKNVINEAAERTKKAVEETISLR